MELLKLKLLEEIKKIGIENININNTLINLKNNIEKQNNSNSK
ncbi:hypothetical protein WG909_07460 [Peptostreptococcaceae bacterium AGR-M142]